MFVMCGCSARRAIACISRASRQVGPLRARAFQEHGRLHVHERQRPNSVSPPSSLQVADAQQCLAQWRGWSTWPNIAVAVLRRPKAVGGAHDLEPLRRVDLVGQITRRTSSSRVSRRCRAASRARRAQLGKEPPSVTPSVRAPCHTSSWRKRMHVDLGRRPFDGPADVE